MDGTYEPAVPQYEFVLASEDEKKLARAEQEEIRAKQAEKERLRLENQTMDDFRAIVAKLSATQKPDAIKILVDALCKQPAPAASQSSK